MENNLPPDIGWKHSSGSLIPVMMNEASAPENLLKLCFALEKADYIAH